MSQKVKTVSVDHYQRACQFETKGKLDQARRCCMKAIDQNALHAQAFNLLGVVSFKQNLLGEAINCIAQALRINPSYAEAYNNLGFLYNENASYDHAITSFRKALAYRPNYVDAMYNMGNAYLKQKCYPQAIECYQKTIEWDAFCVKAHHNMGNAFYNMGMLDKASECYRSALDCTHDSTSVTEVFVSLAAVTLYRDGLGKWKECLHEVLVNVTFPLEQEAEILVSLAIAYWIEGKEEQSKIYLGRISEEIYRKKAYPLFNSLVAFYNFMKNLVTWYSQNSLMVQMIDKAAVKTIHFIGDSHALTCAEKCFMVGDEVFYGRTHFVKGCKIYHLTNGKKNASHIAFERELNSILPGEFVVFAVGEIDCRFNEGLFYRYRRYNTDLKGEAGFLLDAFFEKIVLWSQDKKFVPLLWGIPAPHERALPKDVPVVLCQEFLDFVQWLNAEMKKRAKIYGFKCIDNYRLTATDKKYSTSATHLDDYHLKPDVFIKAMQCGL